MEETYRKLTKEDKAAFSYNCRMLGTNMKRAVEAFVKKLNLNPQAADEWLNKN